MLKIFKKLVKNPIAIAIILASLILALSVIAYSLINQNNNRDQALNSIINADKYFNGLPFQEDEYILGSKDNAIT